MFKADRNLKWKNILGFGNNVTFETDFASAVKNSLTGTFHDKAFIIPAINLNYQWFIEPDMPDKFVFIKSRYPGQVSEVVETVVHKRVDGKVAYPE